MTNELVKNETGKELKEYKLDKKTIPINEFQDKIQDLIPSAGTIILTPAQEKILYADVNPDDVEIRPDGLIYLPWMEYVTRLRKAFGAGWAIIPQGMPSIMGNHIYWGFYLVIGGKLAGFAIGEQEYYPDNRKMTYGDACEGAKSNALMRLCKGIGISLELWKPAFIGKWKQKYAETYEQKDKYGNIKTYWRKQGQVEEEIETTKEEEKVDIPRETPTTKRSSKEILYERLVEYCKMENGEVDTGLMGRVLQETATKKDGTPIKSWGELEKVDAEKYEKWFAKILKNFMGR